MTYTSHCEGCPLQGKAEVNCGTGKPDARFLVVVDAPSARPETYNRLMTQSSMKMFSKHAHAEQFDRNDFFFYPQVRCAYDPDVYTTKEKSLIQKHCRPHLVAQVRGQRPEVIIPLGGEPSKQVHGRAVKITKIRGLPVPHDEFTKTVVLPMLNPLQAVLYPQHEPAIQTDFATLGRLVDNDYDIRKTGSVMAGDYEFIDDLEFLVKARPEQLAYDTENTGLRWYAADASILTMQFCIEPGKAYLLPWDHPDAPQTQRAKARLKKQLRALLCAPNTRVVGQNPKYDCVYTYAQTGVRFQIGGDTLMLATLIDENALTKNLADLTKRYVPDMSGYSDHFDAQIDKSRMIDVPLDEKFLNYGAGDADAGFRLHDELYATVAQDKKLLAHYHHVTLPGLNAFASIELRGQHVSPDAADEFEVFMDKKVSEQRESLLLQVPKSIKRAHVDKGIKFSRADFLRDILFDHPDGFRLKPKVYTKTTAKLDPARRVPSTSTKDHLPYFYDTCPFTFELADHIKASRILDTNVKGFRKKYIVGDMVRPVYGMHVAVTGRTNCVHADTPIPTGRGIVRAADVEVGDTVTSHTGATRKVRQLFLKAPTLMYSLHLSNGEVLTVTAHHRVMLESGLWADVGFILERDGYAITKQDAHAQPGTCSQGSHDLPAGVGDARGSGRTVRGQPSNGAGHDSCVYTGQGVQYPEGYEIPRIQTRGEEPAVRDSVGDRLPRWGGVPDALGRGRTVLRAPHSHGRVPGDSSFADTGHGEHSPHRREPEEQRHLQSGADDTSGTSSNPRQVPVTGRGLVIEKVVCAGVHRVHDFEVEHDKSYVACGVINHNSEDPNGQNVPKRGPTAMAYRKMFVAPPGYFLIENDLSQAELRIAADMSNDPTMLEIYRTGGDIHTATALIVMGVSMETFRKLPKQEQKDARTKAKAVNFGFLYGMSWRKFIAYAKTQYGAEFTEKEAQRVRVRFFEKYSSLLPWHAKMREYAHQHKFVRSYSGRVRHLPMIESSDEGIRAEAERQAINSPVQEFGSSLGVMALGRMEQELNPEYLQIVGFVHDAIYAYVPEKYVEWGTKTLRWYMETNPVEEWFGRKMKVPIVADAGFGRNLGSLYEMGSFDIPKDGRVTVGDYDFDALFTDEEDPIVVPRQRIPPNNGRLVLP